MVFVTLGSQKFQFNRLLKALDEQISQGEILEECFAQIGASTYKPQNYKYIEYLDRDEFERLTNQADIVIAHGGTGAIIGALKKNKKVIAVPRLSMYGEHVDDHQLQLVEQFKDLNLIYVCNDVKQLSKIIIDIKKQSFEKYQSNTDKIIDSIEKFINL